DKTPRPAGRPRRPPDDALLRSMALTYSTPYTAMYNGEFDQGITNGAAWYVITGSFQDWNYGFTDCIDITCEVSNIKWPAASTLDSYWNQNQESILSFMEYAQRGLHGTVTSTDGLPLDATITVAGNARAVHTDPALGDYHRLLLGGTYNVTASSPGFISQTFPANVPANGGATLNFVLEPAQLVTFIGTIRDIEGYPVPQAVVSINTDPVTTVNSSADGMFMIPSIYEGNYEFRISCPDLPTQIRNVQISEEHSSQTIVLTQPLFEEGFEQGISNWTLTSPWAIAIDGANNVLKDSPSGNYGNNINKSAKLTNPVSLVGIQDPTLSFGAKYALESGYDFVHIEASSNGSSWTNLASFSGTQSSWQDYSYSLSALIGSNCYIRFRIQTDQNTTADGISIDDVQINGRASSQIIHGDITQDGIINSSDLNQLLSHIIDPDIPGWHPQMTEASDVDNNDIVNSLDAYMLHRYISDSSYRFVVQTGQPETFPQLDLDYSYDPANSTLHLSFSNAQALRALDFVLGDPSSTMITSISATEGITEMHNLSRNAFACISDGQNLEISINLSTSLTSMPLIGYLNGHPLQISIILSTASAGTEFSPMANALAQNYPNPFNPSTTISYSLARSDEQVHLQIFNARGQLVRTLVNESQLEGIHRLVWNGKDDLGRDLAAGLYLYRLQTGDFVQTNRMLLLK
ncbi:MAG: carboxypeptidase regulatory-like domain-containing protein, partial [Candidatus Cloacimonadota bacterium]